MADETVRVDIVLNAHAAIRELQALTKATKTVEEQTKGLGDFFARFSKENKMSLSEVGKLFKDLNSEVLSAGGKNIFGKHGDDVANLAEAYNRVRREAGVFKTDNKGVVTSLGAVGDQALAVSQEIDKLYKPRQTRDLMGRFGKSVPAFDTQLKGLKDYSSQLRLVENTIQKISKTTGASFADVGRSLEKAFPDLKNMNLVGPAIDNLNKKVMGLAGSFKSLREVAARVDEALAGFAKAGGLKLLGTNKENVEQLVSVMKAVKASTGASFEQVAAGMRRMGVDGAYVGQAMQQLRKELSATEKSLSRMKQVAMQVDQELAKMAQGGRFSFAGSKASNVNDVANALREIKKAVPGASFEQIAAGMRRMGIDGERIRQGLQQVNSEMKTFKHGIDIVRTALGTLVAVGIFQFLSGLSKIFGELVNNLRETELALYNLVNAEKRLSEEGIDVTPKGLEETVKAVRELVPILSQIQAEELVSRIATNVAPALKLTSEQIKQMAEATALLYVRNKALGKSFDEVESQLTNAFLTGKVSQGINNLGVKINDQIVKDEALRLGLVKTEKQFDNLTGEMESQVKAAAMLSVVYKNATQDVSSLDEYMKTTDASFESVSTLWSDLATNLGVAFAPLIRAILSGAIQLLEKLNKSLEENGKAWQSLATVLTGMVNVANAVLQLFTDISLVVGKLSATFIELFQKIPIIGNIVKSLFPDKDVLDTPTAAVENLNDALKDLDTKTVEKLRDIFKDTANAVQDLAIKLNQKIADINTEYRRKELDAETDYLRKVEDINRDAERDIAKAKAKHRQEDQRDEEKYQLALWELRMRFLMDLEDALHARDARQVIRLQKQYNLDKEILRRRHELENKEREQRQADELEDIERRRQERLEDARLEYEQKLADLNLAKQREMQDLSVWYAREFADLQMAQDRKLKELLAGWAREQQITEENAAAVYAILQRYFGPGGYTDELYQYMMQSLIASTQGAIAAAASMMGQLGTHDTGGHTTSGGGSAGGHSGGGGGGGRGRAEGGTLIATRPTTVTFGEAGLEMATFTPLTRIGKNVGKVDVNGSLAGLGGNIAIDLTLSPDLEARAVAKSMDGVADVILRINGSKV